MKAIYKKETLQDPEKKGGTYTNYLLLRDTKFCCEKFQEHCKKFNAWSYDHGKFSIVDQISYENHSVITIEYCPFCGEKIEYGDKNSPKKTYNKKLK